MKINFGELFTNNFFLNKIEEKIKCCQKRKKIKKTHKKLKKSSFIPYLKQIFIKKILERTDFQTER